MLKYCESISTTKRQPTRQVMVGSVGVGGSNPIRIQSMTTSNTREAKLTADQIKRLADAGCEIARVTVQGIKEAEACEQIKNELIQAGYTIPLVADIHFFPPAALRAADFVDKVRINPGNYSDKRASFKTLIYDDITYAHELEKIEEKFTPLVEKCKRLKRAMRIGTNHGSLSDRIMNRYGDTPRGMVESAFEFARICRQQDYHDFIFSMKSSNPQVMILAYRLLVAEMRQLGWDYPLHLGVTEAGAGEDGRIKSAIGIGALLLDGLGDTLRVSLTEDAWHEIKPCQQLISLAQQYRDQGQQILPFEEHYRPFEALPKRVVDFPKNISLHRDGTVLLACTPRDLEEPTLYQSLDCEGPNNTIKLKTSSVDCVVVQEKVVSSLALEKLTLLKNQGISVLSAYPAENEIPLLGLHEALLLREQQHNQNRFRLASTPPLPLAVLISDQVSSIQDSISDSIQWDLLKQIQPSLVVLAPKTARLHYARYFFEWLQAQKLAIPVILHFHYTCSREELLIQAAAEFGALLCDGLGEGIWIEAPHDRAFLRNLSFNILQAARKRAFKTDFISCPSCGRTLFDLQEVSKQIRDKTAHLPGVKIAIMGCIVNGPGEMADADFGYVGSKPGMIDLYVGKKCVEKDITFANAVERLINLIKQENRWLESPVLLAHQL